MQKIVCFLILLALAEHTWALRCQGNLIDEGDTQAKVEQLCGDPNSKKTITTTQPLYNSSGAIYGSVPFLTEIWTYQASPEDFIYSVYFTNKIVTSINSSLKE